MNTKTCLNFVLTIHNSASCFNDFETRLLHEKGLSYFYIKHDSDIADNGENTPIHYHIVLSYNNTRPISRIIEHFPGAHVEQALDLNNAVQYLSHKNNENKHQYPYENIQTNNADLLKKLYYNNSNNCLNGSDFPQLTEKLIFEEIETRHCISIVHFYQIYGFKQTLYYRTMILDLLKCVNTANYFKRQNDKINSLTSELEDTTNSLWNLIDSCRD